MFSVCIYDNYNKNKLILNYQTQTIAFGTAVPGGYEGASFNVAYQKDKPLNLWINKHVEIFDIYGDKVFEGFLEKPRGAGDKLEMSASGYFKRGEDISAGPIYFSGQYVGALVSVSISTAGTGYERGDILTVANGTNGQIRVDQVDDTGVVQDILINSYGQGYSIGTESCSGGTGSGFVVSIDSVETGSSSYAISKFMTDLNPYWRDNFSMIDRLDRIPVGPLTFTRSDKTDQALEEASKFGYLDVDHYSSPRRRQLYYAMYNDRVLQMKRNPDIRIDEPDWEIALENFLEGQPLTMEVDDSGIANEIWVEFNDPDSDGNSFTLGTRDRNSIEKYGVRQHVESIGEATIEVAEVVEELLVEHKTEPTYSSTLKIAGEVHSRNGVAHPVWKIRAGDLIRITDIDVGLENLSGSRLSAITFVSNTKYDHKNRSMNITLGTGKRLDLILKRLGV